MNNLKEMNQELTSLLPQTFICTQQEYKLRLKNVMLAKKLEVEQCDYMDMPRNLVEVDDKVKEINIEDISNTKGEDMAIN